MDTCIKLVSLFVSRFLTALPWYNKISQNHFLSLLVGKVWSPVKQNVKRLVVRTFFQRIITSSVILSVVAVSVEHHKQVRSTGKVKVKTAFLWQ